MLNLELLDVDPHVEEFVNERGEIENVTVVEDGIGKHPAVYTTYSDKDLSDYYPSVEWDIMSRKARRRARIYQSCCPDSGAFVEINVTYTLIYI